VIQSVKDTFGTRNEKVLRYQQKIHKDSDVEPNSGVVRVNYQNIVGFGYVLAMKAPNPLREHSICYCTD
jgi:hypothetical protein|tara:strand:- start:561 stop:767 length:207 start_codon:yes stop_codon:yes gene_type:complete